MGLEQKFWLKSPLYSYDILEFFRDKPDQATRIRGGGWFRADVVFVDRFLEKFPHLFQRLFLTWRKGRVRGIKWDDAFAAKGQQDQGSDGFGFGFNFNNEDDIPYIFHTGHQPAQIKSPKCKPKKIKNSL